MKPGEFDDLVRQKFEQNDFEFNPRNWDKLTEELDGQKKRRGLLFWWMPLVGVAATVAMAFGVSKVIREGSHMGATMGAEPVAAHAHKHKAAHAQVALVAAKPDVVPAQDASDIALNNTAAQADVAAKPAQLKENTATIDIKTALNANQSVVGAEPKPLETFADNTEFAKKKKKPAPSLAYYTFKDEEPVKKPTKVAIILSGGVNYNNQSSGYMVGATARRMINDKVYVESDVAFIGTNNSQKVQYMDKSGAASGSAATGLGSMSVMGARSSAGKNTDESLKGTTVENPGVLKTQDQAYNLYYAQITPSIGYKIMKKLSIGAGPDFQQMLVDNRPEASAVDRGNIKVAPMFDIGFMGKTEYAISKNVKAAVYYREGVNNVITPTNKYIDRNYLQFQVKCTILNR